MKLPTPDPDQLEQLISTCLGLYEGRGAGAVDELLLRHADSADLVRNRLDLLSRMGLIGEAPEHSMPEHIGDYRITAVLGRGGMGVVYEAEQETPRRTVALKVLRTLPGPAARSRFREEAELLARLSHPGIAAVYEVGTATLGGLTVPFFAMELVRGARLDVFAKEASLDTRERLALVAKICDAVQHAHQKGIVHRDLKPANIMLDERGEPRVLDFGVARVMDPDHQRETLLTEVGQLVGTLAYMSPEQASGNPADVDSRADVYALGVIAYELLCGELPHAVEGRSMLQVLESLRDDEAAPLSQRDSSLRGDVERIVAKALEKDKERRYASAQEFSADITRYLNHEPISARPATATYQLAKFARRNRVLVSAAAAVVLALALGLIGTLNGMLSTAEQRDDAERRFRLANATLKFQKHMFASADPMEQGVRVDELLDRALLRVDSASDDPLEIASFLLMLGDAYEGLGLYGKAAPLITRTAEIFGRELGAEDLQTLSAKTRLAALYGHPLGRLEQAESALEGVLETALRVHGATHDVTLDAQLVHAALEFERGDYGEASLIARAVLEVVDPDRPQWVSAQKFLAKSLRATGAVDEAIAIAHEVHTLTLERFGKNHPDTWSAMDTLGNVLVQEGRLLEGQRMLDELLALRTEHLGRHHADTLNSMLNAAVGHTAGRDQARAEKLLKEVIQALETRYPATHPERLAAMNALGNVYLGQNRGSEAEQIFSEVLEHSTLVHGAEHPDTLATMGNLALSLLRMRHFDEAEELYLATLELEREVSGNESSRTVLLIYNVGAFYRATGRFEEAAAFLREAIERGREVLGPDNYLLGTFLRGYGTNCTYLKRYEEAEAAYLEAREWNQRTLPNFETHPSYLSLLSGLKSLYEAWGKPEEAAQYARLLEDRP